VKQTTNQSSNLLPNFNVDKFIADSLPPMLEEEKLLRSMHSTVKTPLVESALYHHYQPYHLQQAQHQPAVAHHQQQMVQDSPLFTPVALKGDAWERFRQPVTSRYANVGALNLPMAVGPDDCVLSAAGMGVGFAAGAVGAERKPTTTTTTTAASIHHHHSGPSATSGKTVGGEEELAMQSLEMNLRNVAKIWHCPAF